MNPQAQSFFVDANQFPLGVFLRDVSLFFTTKDDNLPVSVQIRPVINGFPSASAILPFSEVTRNPDSITANSTPTATVFPFDSPVYLSPGEYAITVISNSSEYKLYTATIGDDVTGTSRKVSAQPNVGSFYEPQNSGEYKANPNTMMMFKLNRCEFVGQSVTGANNFVRLDAHANGAAGNTANVLYQTFKTTGSFINFSNTAMDFQFKSFDTSNSAVEFTNYSMDQNITLSSGRQMTSSTNGMFTINASMATVNSHVSPVIDIDRMNLIVIDNDIDDAGLSANDVVIVSGGTGYTKVGASAYTATVAASESANTATVNVHVEVTLSVNTSYSTTSGGLKSANAGYTVNDTSPGQFAIGEAVRVVGVDITDGTVTNPVQVLANTPKNSVTTSNSGYGIITGRTFVDSDSTKNVASITIKTSANNAGFFKPGTLIRSDNTAQQLAAVSYTHLRAHET